MDNERAEKRSKVASDILHLSRNTLLVNLRFLDAALNELKLYPMNEIYLATDGQHLVYNPSYVLKCYKEERESIARAYLHMLFHSVFRHMFVHSLIEQYLWDLACDIASEYVIYELNLKATTTYREQLQKRYYSELEKKAGKLTAEKLYRYFLDHRPDGRKLAELQRAFYADDHRLWYMTEAEKKVFFGQQFVVTVSAGDEEHASGDDEGNGGGKSATERFAGAALSISAAETRWTEISNRMQMDMETFSKQQGDKAGGLMQNLREVNREKYDYTAFLKKFAARGEVMRVNDDEFDYIFYTYGLKLYKKVPLIEPLEYKEVKRIREFVIAIDTSGSVAGEQVQRFIQKTYNILKSAESFFSRINLHIIQCDATIQEDAKITSQEEFDEYLKTLNIHGLGGTDFRPVFRYVDWLQEKKVFQNLKGLVYFTDGFGTFPAQKPDYDTAFIFVDDGWNNYDVPPWAIKLILQKEDF